MRIISFIDQPEVIKKIRCVRKRMRPTLQR
jgi:hypothetical protein